MSTSSPDNEEIAALLERVAELLEAQGANVHRVRAYRRASEAIARRPDAIAPLATEGGEGALEALPTIGKSIAGAILEYVHTGRLGLLDRLEGEVSPEDLFCTVPGIGHDLAAKIHEGLHVETLEELEVAALDGRLAAVPGVGDRRLRGIRANLDEMLSQSTRRRARLRHQREARGDGAHEARREWPATTTILGIDADYRRRAAAGELRRIAPRRFNPEGEAWLPILHEECEGWSFTALFSNTARAHQLGKTDDWVVIYFERDGHEDQCTVVTETHGSLEGQRVIRGHEQECQQFYAER